MEDECGFIVVEGIHRVIVSLHYAIRYMVLGVRVNMTVVCTLHQAVIGMFNELPTEFVSVVLRPGMAPELLWRVSWALNGIGHNIVELSVFDWLAAIIRQRNETYVPPPL